MGRSASQREIYTIQDDVLQLLCEFDYPGNIRALRNLVYELTSYVDETGIIPIELVQFALARSYALG